MNYKGFEIKKSFIYKNGKEVYINSWRSDRDESNAIRLIDKELKRDEKFNKMPDLQLSLKKMFNSEYCCELENGIEDRERFEEKMNDYFENQLNERCE